jgi:hypothetical protein
MPVTQSPQQGQGVAITFASGFMAWITDVSVTGISRAPLETTNSATTVSRTFIPEKLVNYGELRVSLQLKTSADPPIEGAAETVTITWPMETGGTTAPTWSGTGFMTGYEATGSINGIMTATATLKITGTLTFTAGS